MYGFACTNEPNELLSRRDGLPFLLNWCNIRLFLRRFWQLCSWHAGEGLPLASHLGLECCKLVLHGSLVLGRDLAAEQFADFLFRDI